MWLKSGLFLLTERRGPNFIRSQPFAILDGGSVIFSTVYVCEFQETFY